MVLPCIACIYSHLVALHIRFKEKPEGHQCFSRSLSFFGEGSPTKIDYRKKGTLILTFLLEDLVLRQIGTSLREGLL